jgi:hypothetical protein
MIDFSKYKLLNNPFRISPAINADELIWAGMGKLKKKIDDRIEISAKTSPTRVVLNWGRYGSGKTHAANFYTRTPYINNTLGYKTKNIKVNLPRGSKEPVQAFLRALVGQLNFEKIVEDFKSFKEAYGEEAESIIESCTQDSIIAQALKSFLVPKIASEQSLFGEIKRPVSMEAMRNFLYGDSSKGVLKELNLPLGLDDDEQVVNLISGLFNVISYEKKLYHCIFLWIDEFEDIDTLPKTSQDRFTTFLRQLIDKCPNHLTLFLNFTLKGIGELEDLSIVLGEALSSRTKLYLDFESPTIPEAESYITELLNHIKFRKEEDQVAENIYYPFTKSAVDFVLENLDRLTARKINETFSLILEMALIKDNVPEEIGMEFIQSIKDEIPSWKQ